MSRHIMVDIETLGLRQPVPVVSIGAVAFDPDAGKLLGEEFESHIRLADAIAYGGVDPDTLLWWLQQEDAARAALVSGQARAVGLRPALLQLAWFIGATDVAGIWSHGATFDIPALEAAFSAHSLQAPWSYRTPRDTRTLFALAGYQQPERGGVKHSALDDARNQALDVMAAYESLQHRP